MEVIEILQFSDMNSLMTPSYSMTPIAVMHKTYCITDGVVDKYTLRTWGNLKYTQNRRFITWQHTKAE